MTAPKEKNILKNIDYSMSVFLKSCKILLVIFLVILGVKFYLIVNQWINPTTQNISSLPSQNLDYITLIIDDNYQKNSKTILQKMKEKFLEEKEQQSRIEYKSGKVFIIINGQYKFLNSELKKQFCTVYTKKYQEEIDLNKKRVDEVLQEFYCEK